MSLKQRIKQAQIFNLLHLCLDAVIVRQKKTFLDFLNCYQTKRQFERLFDAVCSATTPVLYTARELGTNPMQQNGNLTAKGSPTQSQGKLMNKHAE
jgi:hypothetical protein